MTTKTIINSVIRSRSLFCQNFENNMLNTRVFQNDFLSRGYAKGKDKKKENKGKGLAKNIIVNENLISEVINFEKLKSDMETNLHHLKENFSKYLSLRTAAGSVESMTVVYESKKYPLIELAQITRNNPKTIVLDVSSFPQVIPSILKTISQSGMNLNPQQDGTKIFLPVPRVTKEHRETLAKNAKSHFIKCRDGIKDTHMKYVKSIKNKEKEGLSQDLSSQISDQIKSLADGYVNQAEDMLKKKQDELLNG